MDFQISGQWEFSGDFEINAFGGLTFHGHTNVSRSLMGFAISGVNNDSWKCENVSWTVPTIPSDQMTYLRGHTPG